jgi:hypothetical protein
MSGSYDRVGRVTGMGVVVLLAACSGAEVSAGSEGEAVNLARCFGVSCGARAQRLQVEDVEADVCGDVAGVLEQPVRFEPVPDSEVFAADEAPDGSVWALLNVRGVKNVSYGGAVRLAHFSEDGALLDQREIFGSDKLGTSALTVDTSGIVVVGHYYSHAPHADGSPMEELSLSEYGSNLQLNGAPSVLQGIATPRLFGAVAGSVWVAGNATSNGRHGVLSRVSQREPDWVQTAVPSAGESVGALGGLTVADDGTAAVVARSNAKWTGSGPQVTKLTLSTFDAVGLPLWTLALPTAYTAGYNGSLGGTAQGDLVVASPVGENGDALLVRQITRQGALGWGYRIEPALGAGIEVKRRSGRTLASVGNGVVVIDADGARCRKFLVPMLDPNAPGSPTREPDADYFFGVNGGLLRFRVPE